MSAITLGRACSRFISDTFVANPFRLPIGTVLLVKGILMMNRNKRRINKANKGARPNNSTNRKAKRTRRANTTSG
ncbi:hypothetical protein AAMO2058_000939800 [Amorphochlora amoebiformis]